MLQVIFDRFGKRHGFSVASDGDQVVWQIGMIDALDFLLDDRALVQIAGDVVIRRPNQFHAALIGLVIRLGALETGQE
ncbi:hypothetical protein D3C77_743940 [compost metagenome]